MAGTGIGMAESDAARWEMADAVIDRNRAALVDGREQARRLAADGDAVGAVQLVERLALGAWLNHPGFVADPGLERLVEGFAPAGGPARRADADRIRPRRVLHVLSQVYATGGHTRLVERLVQEDEGRRHSIVLTAQHAAPVPRLLREVAERSGGRLVVLDDEDPLARASRLRAMARGFDVVVGAPHPNDAVPLLAFADPATRPPTICLNHSDHLFWLGVDAWDVVANLRAAGDALTRTGRGVPAWRSAVLAAPLPESLSVPDRERARASLGLEPDTIVLLTAASAYKYRQLAPEALPAFLDVVLPVVRADDRLVLYALGPSNRGEWAEAARATGGRVTALGQRLDPGRFQQAADVYLDSLPIGSTYSALEAGARLLPVLSFCTAPEQLGVLLSASPGLDGAAIMARNPAAHRAALQDLVDDVDRRRELGRATGAQIASLHAGDGWRAGLRDLYAAAVAARGRRVDEGPVAVPDGDAPPAGHSLLDRATTLIQQVALPKDTRVRSHVRLVGW